MTSETARFVRCMALFALVAVTTAAQVDPAAEQQRGIDILKSAAPAAEKAMACKRLAIYGTKEAVPALAPLLSHTNLASWARIALEAIPDPAAVAALRDALSGLQGNLLIGAINSLGVRRDPEAFGALAERVKDPDAAVASAAAVALGRIGGARVSALLTPLLAGAPAAVRPAIAEGCILCAEGLLAAGKQADAVACYDAVRAANVSRQKTLEALRGAILARQAAGVPLLAEQLKSPDAACFGMGLRTARELPGPAVAQALLAELERPGPERQAYLLLTLADRGDAEALPAARKAAASGPSSLRIAAIGVLERMGDRSCVPLLLAAAAEADAGVALAAKAALARLPGDAVDAAVVASLKQTDESALRTAIVLCGQRGLTNAIPELLRMAGSPSPAVGAASLKVLGDMAGAAQLPALLAILTQARDTAAAESALSAVCARLARPSSGNVVIRKATYGDPSGGAADVTAKVAALVKTGALAVEASNSNFGDTAGGIVKKLRVEYTVNGTACSKTVTEGESLTLTAAVADPAVVDPLCAALAQAPTGAKPALLRILRAAGGAKALAAVRAAAADADAGVKEAALRMLCDWPTTDALPDVTQLAKTAAEPKWKILALRGELRLIPLQDVPAAQKLAAFKDALARTERTEEKRLALAALGELPSAESLALVATYLAAEGLKDEAGAAAVSIAGAIVQASPAAVASAMAQVATSNEALALRAKQLLAQAKSAAGAGP